MCYCGDAENDLKAVDYMARLAQIPASNVNIFIPKNASPVIKSPQYMISQRGNNKFLKDDFMFQGKSNTLKGITYAINAAYLNGRRFIDLYLLEIVYIYSISKYLDMLI